MSSVSDLIKESVARLFAEQIDRALLESFEKGVWPGALWRLVEESGFPLVLANEPGEDPGAWGNAYPLLYAVGFYRLPLPLAESIIANGLLALAGLPAQDGPLSLFEQDANLSLRLQGDRLVLNGAAAAVPWARYAKRLVVAGGIGERRLLAIVETSARGVAIAPATNIAGEPRDGVRFDDARCREFADWREDLPATPVTLLSALARAAMMVGAAASVLQQSVDYANERVQFGKPIGKFQAIQQALAVLGGEVSSAQMATLVAFESARAYPATFDVAVAKIRSGQTAGIAASIAHQVHGSFGLTYEHTLHYATRRLWSWRAEYGSEANWAAVLGRQAIALGGEQFWPALLAR